MMKSKWYNNSETEILIQENQDIPDGFVRGRLHRRSRIDELVEMISREALYAEFIVNNTPLHKIPDKFGISEKDVRLLLTRYKIRKNPKQSRKNNSYIRTHEQSVEIGKKSSITQKLSWNSKSDEEKQKWSEYCSYVQLHLNPEIAQLRNCAYSNWWNNLSDEQKQNINQQRSNTMKSQWFEHGSELIARMKNTEKQNRINRVCRSIAEQQVYDKLIKIYPDLIYDIRVDDRYPFYCDFYIPSKDLFIELNAHPSHGRLPMKYLSFDEYSRYPQKWTDVFAKRDVIKQQYAEDNNLNYIMIYPNATLQENIEINSYSDKDLIKTIYDTQS